MEESKRGISYKWIALIITSIGAFNASLDMGVINFSLPRLREVFGVGPEAVLWVSLIYPLLGSSLLLTWGRLGDTMGRERVFTIGLFVATVGLALCTLAPNNTILIGFRIIQVIGLSMVLSVAPAIAVDAFPAQERGRTLGIFFAISGAGIIIGPLLSGFLLDHFAWQSIFYSRLPIAVATSALAFSLLKRPAISTTKQSFDIRGAVILLGGLFSFILAVNQGRIQGWLSPFVLSLDIAAIVLFSLFFIVERRVAQPLLDLRLFRDRVFTTAILSTVVAFVSLLMFTVLMPFYLMEGANYSPTTAGAVMTIYGVIFLPVSPLGGWLGDKLSPTLICPVGLAFISLGLFLISGLSADTSIAGIILPVMVWGFGFGLFLGPNSSAILGSVSSDKLGTASALMNTARQIGQSIGPALGITLFASRKLFHTAQLTSEGVGQETAERLGVVGGFHDVILVAMGFSILALIVSLLMRGRTARG